MLVGCWAQSQKDSSVYGEITKFGIYIYQRSNTDSKIPQASTIAGYSSVGPSEFLYSGETAKVNAGQGVGFDYTIHLNRVADDNRVKVVIEHPSITNPEGKVLNVSSYFRDLPVNPGVYSSQLVYFFEKPFEMVPGDWNLQIYYDDKLIVGKKFRVSF